MERFRRMLSQTAGEDLFDFWLDCEYFKDVMEQLDEQENTAIRNILFRYLVTQRNRRTRPSGTSSSGT